MNIKKFFKYFTELSKTNLRRALVQRQINKTPGEKDALSLNSRFKDIHKGERCFILGNGPSLKYEDLSLLRDEYVFCVNQIARNSQFREFAPNYYVCVDMNFFKIDETNDGDKELLAAFYNLSTVNNLECFFPYRIKKNFVERFALQEKLNVNYIHEGLTFYDTFNKDIDMTGPMPTFGTVVQHAITIAIYMGFSEIYLLGCDTTGIVVTINSILQRDNQAYYSYDVSDNENKRMTKCAVNGGIENYCVDYLNTIIGFRRLNDYCAKRGVQLTNCSKETVIDSIERKSLDSVLKGD